MHSESNSRPLQSAGNEEVLLSSSSNLWMGLQENMRRFQPLTLDRDLNYFFSFFEILFAGISAAAVFRHYLLNSLETLSQPLHVVYWSWSAPTRF